MRTCFVDAHCHLQFDAYTDDRDFIIKQMREQNVSAVVVGCDLESSRQAAALAETHDNLVAAIGLHPAHAPQEVFNHEAYRALAAHPKVVAIGECGLDFFRVEDTTDAAVQEQKNLFTMQIALAAELDKPLIIHARPTRGTMDAYHDALELLTEAKKAFPNLRGDMHFFAGGLAEAEACIALGFTVSFTAVITFAREYDAVIRALPLASILAETDAPYVAPVSHRGERNDPLAVIEVVAKIAEIRGDDLETVRTALLSNTMRLFAL